MAVTVKQDAIVDKGGNKLINCVLSSAFALSTPVSGTNVFDLGALANSDVSLETAKETFSSEDGEVQATSYTYTLLTVGVLMQSDKDLINYMANTVRGAIILECKYTGLNTGGNDQWIFKIGNVKPAYSVKRPGGTSSMPYEFTGIKLSSAVTFTSTTMGSLNTALSLTASGFPTAALTIPAGSATVTSHYIDES